MANHFPQKQSDDSVADLTARLMDALLAQGDTATAESLVDLLEPVSGDDGLTLRRADAELARGDAAAALKLLIPRWEAGSTTGLVEARLALAALALGLDETVESLTLPPDQGAPTLEHAALRLLLAASRGERALPVGRGVGAALSFAVRGQLRLLSACGRDDLVHAAAAAGFESAAAGFPARQRALGTPVSVPFPKPEDAFETHWLGSGGSAAANWAWAVAREVGQGERVLLLTSSPAAFVELLAHAEVFALAPRPAPGANAISRPEHLPVGRARFRHVIAADWFGHTLQPEAAFAEATASLCLEGQLHALCPGAAERGHAELSLSQSALERLARGAGLDDVATVTRAADGRPASGSSAAFVLLSGRRLRP